MRKLVVSLLRFYKLLISPFLGNNCRFYPSCSDYAVEAVETHGIFVGLYKAGKRILRCNPWNAGGFDPVAPECSHSHQNTDSREQVNG